MEYNFIGIFQMQLYAKKGAGCMYHANGDMPILCTSSFAFHRLFAIAILCLVLMVEVDIDVEIEELVQDA